MRKILSLLLFLCLLIVPFGCSDDDSAATYTITYDKNGATGGVVPVDPTNYEAGRSVSIASNSGNLVRVDYGFVGWNTAADGGGTDVAAGSTFTMPAINVVLYAKWIDLFAGVTKRELVSVPGGTYTQTDTDASPNSFNHTIFSAFKMGKFQVTYELWYTVYSWATNNGYTFANAGREGKDGTIGATPTVARFNPVTTVNWRDVIVWCNAYSEMMGYTPVYYSDGGYNNVLKTSSDTSSVNITAGSYDNPYVNWSATGYRLPTEGEWQYAASYKDGLSWTTPSWASGATADYNNSTATRAVAWYSSNSGNTTHDVGTKTANQLGIYDMSGNVYDWCWDWHGTWPTASQSDYKGAASGSYRVRRGGSWGHSADSMRVGDRDRSNPDFEYSYIGFRVCRSGF